MMLHVQGSQPNSCEEDDFGAKSMKIMDRGDRGNMKFQSPEKSHNKMIHQIPDKSKSIGGKNNSDIANIVS